METTNRGPYWLCQALQKMIVATMVMPSLMACDASHLAGNVTENSSVQTVSVSPEAIAAFQDSVYYYGQIQGCVRCHGSRVSPNWMSSNIDLAYAVARPLLDINNSSVSVFAYYAGNNHCNDPVCADPANVAVMQGYLQQWAATEVIVAGGGSQPVTGGPLPNPTYVTVSLPVPANLPTIFSASPAVIRFQLAQLSPPVPKLASAVLEISIQSYNVNNSEYKVFNPRIIGATGPVDINGIHVYVRTSTGTGLGIEDVNQGDLWSNVKVTVPATAKPVTFPTTPYAAVSPMTSIPLAIQAQSATDVLTIGFFAIH